MTFKRNLRRRATATAALVCAVATGSTLIAPAASAAPTIVTVDSTTRFQTLEGWGTSLAWWANILGGWSEPRRTQVADLLFHPTNGLGLDIVRYNLGAGTNPNPTKNMRVGAEVPTFLPTPGNYDWSADANQRWMLDAAKARGTTTVEGFVNSPPAWMLSTACTAGAPDGGNNLPPARYTDFANYIADVSHHFSTTLGTTFRTVSAFNEPSAAWWKCSNNQEGNHVDATEQSKIVTAVAAALRARGLPTGVSAAEEYSVERSHASFLAYPKAAQDASSQINTHTYNATGSSKLRAVARENGKRLWTSEVGIGGTGGFNAQDLSSALQLAQRVQGDLTELRADAFVYWQAIEDDDGNNNYGFIKADFGGSETYTVTKQYSAMANYSRYIAPGSIVLQSNDSKTLTTLDPATGKLVLVAYNDGTGSRDLQYDLSSLGTVSTSAQRIETSAANSAATLSPVAISGRQLSVSLPARSITTLVVDGASLPAAEGTVLTNGGFEDGTAGWTGEWNPTRFTVDTTNPAAGNRGAKLSTTATQDVAASQTLTAASSGRMNASVFVDTDLVEGVRIGIDVDGVRKDSRPAITAGGYHRYDFTADVTAGSQVKIWVYAPKAAGTTRVDQAVLSPDTSLLSNSGFESGALTGWTGEWHPNRVTTEQEFPFNGRFDASVSTSATEDAAIMQTITAPRTGTYTLTAAVASSKTATLGVDVAGAQVATLPSTPGGGYKTVKTSFTATAGQSIKVWYYSGTGDGWATIDDVSLR